MKQMRWSLREKRGKALSHVFMSNHAFFESSRDGAFQDVCVVLAWCTI